MNLEKGITVFSWNLKNQLNDRIMTTTVKKNLDDNNYYPQDHLWRQLTDNELKLLIDKKPPKEFQTIGFFKTSNSYRKKAEALLKAYTLRELNENQKLHLFTLKYLKSFMLKKDHIDIHNISQKQSNQSTLTTNEGKKIGLHIDSWEKASSQDRGKVRNRICINLGKEHRYFLFMNKRIDELRAKPFSSLNIGTPDHYNRIYFFLEANPNYKLFRIELKPFEAYIAPTENLFHDGSSLNSKSIDISITARGYFGIKPRNKYIYYYY
ncbi:hypothetical protein [uncultured Psychroserpens sp.]|uniref:hypothetical protein n=1 Tax=uncultured Psychroserpens sp. TaxID=255436 RepID=UPI002626BBBD|nr:hypothetical protein [uncultured Psychroserpens sp.]